VNIQGDGTHRPRTIRAPTRTELTTTLRYVNSAAPSSPSKPPNAALELFLLPEDWVDVAVGAVGTKVAPTANARQDD
jgi:hypothetical protein